MTRGGLLLAGLGLSLLVNATGCGGETKSGRHQGPVGATENEGPVPSASVTGAPPTDPTEEPPAQNAMPSGLDLLLLVDRAGIQNDPPGLFAAITESIVSYFRNGPSDIRVALQLYSREEMDRCAPETYGEPIVPFAPAAEAAAQLEVAFLQHGLSTASDTTPAPAIEGSHAFLRQWSAQNPDRSAGLVVVHRHQDTFCADNQQYIEMLRDVLAASPPVAIFGIQLEMYPGGFPEGSLAYDELSGPPGSGFSWFLDPSPETIPSDLANAFDEIVASAGVAPDPHVLDGPAAPAAGETLPIDPCRGIIRDSNVPEGACLDTHFESSCIGALPPNVASCLTLVSGCIGDVAYVGSYARGCESDAWIDLSCVSASGGYGTSGGLIQANPSYEGAASSMGYLCVCDPSTGQALGARLTVGGMTCEPP